ncbi:hypothetical protein M422DRAFT_43406 [Sphaerobolus stellatus SS14]|nr:hypothetical protein M422DRAFT_43406 [Sphaerobolus stellatus SS14]
MSFIVTRHGTSQTLTLRSMIGDRGIKVGFLGWRDLSSKGLSSDTYFAKLSTRMGDGFLGLRKLFVRCISFFNQSESKIIQFSIAYFSAVPFCPYEGRSWQLLGIFEAAQASVATASDICVAYQENTRNDRKFFYIQLNILNVCFWTNRRATVLSEFTLGEFSIYISHGELRFVFKNRLHHYYSNTYASIGSQSK